MKFNVSLDGLRSVVPSRLRYTDKEPDRVPLTALSYFCDAIQAGSDAEYLISGFGDARWAIDISTELCIFLEQMPSIMPWLSHRTVQPEVVLSFFEQGVERDLIHKFEGDNLSIRCIPFSTSSTSWTPNPEVEIISRDSCELQYRAVVEKFLECARIIDPKAYQDSTFQQWIYDSLNY